MMKPVENKDLKDHMNLENKDSKPEKPAPVVEPVKTKDDDCNSKKDTGKE